jgi:membrane protease YdiL (CAAX protease family)
MIAVGVYVAKLWFDDFRSARAGNANSRALPGATPAPARAIFIAALGSLLLLGAETWGENVFGLTEQQSKMTALFAVYTLLAAIIEEIVFRGFIVVQNRGQLTLWLSVLGASLLFAALHPFLWDWKEGKLLWSFTAKAWFSTGAIFVGSLWFYVARFASFNPRQSLLPCFAAHGAKNLGVIAIKAAQGFLVGWF